MTGHVFLVYFLDLSDHFHFLGVSEYSLLVYLSLLVLDETPEVHAVLAGLLDVDTHHFESAA